VHACSCLASTQALFAELPLPLCFSLLLLLLLACCALLSSVLPPKSWQQQRQQARVLLKLRPAMPVAC
jgi:hypothetical protein